MKPFLQDKFEYTHTCNLKMIHLITPDHYTGDIARLMSHTLNAQHIWNQRILNQQSSYGVWDLHDITDLESLENQNYQETLRLLADSMLERKVHYKNSKGLAFTKNEGAIFFHLINHATYHRGQLMSALKKTGIPPIGLDYIHYV